MKIVVFKKNKKVFINAKRVSFFRKFSGLMFRKKDTQNLLFDFEKDIKMAIHSYFVFFPFLAIWVDRQNKVMETRIVHPFTPVVKPKRPFRRLIEVPFNNRNKQATGFFVGKGKI